MNKQEALEKAQQIILDANKPLLDAIASALSPPSPHPKPDIKITTASIEDLITGGTSTKRYIDGYKSLVVTVRDNFHGVYRITNCEHIEFNFKDTTGYRIILDIRDSSFLTFNGLYLLSRGDTPGVSYGLVMLKRCHDITFVDPRLYMIQPPDGQYSKETDIHGFSFLDYCHNIIIGSTDSGYSYIEGMYGDGIQIHGKDISQISIADITFKECWENAIDVKDGKDISISYNTFKGFKSPKSGSSDGAAICFHDRAAQASISHNTFTKCTKGIRINSNGKFAIRENSFRDCIYGIHTWNSPTIELSNNIYTRVQYDMVNDGNAIIRKG